MISYGFCALFMLAAVGAWKIGEAILRNRKEAFEQHLKHVISEYGHKYFREPAREDYWKLSARIDELEKKAKP